MFGAFGFRWSRFLKNWIFQAASSDHQKNNEILSDARRWIPRQWITCWDFDNKYFPSGRLIAHDIGGTCLVRRSQSFELSLLRVIDGAWRYYLRCVEYSTDHVQEERWVGFCEGWSLAFARVVLSALILWEVARDWFRDVTFAALHEKHDIQNQEATTAVFSYHFVASE